MHKLIVSNFVTLVVYLKRRIKISSCYMTTIMKITTEMIAVDAGIK
jgi:hypothetical protein